MAIDKCVATPNNVGMNLHASKVIDALGGTAEVARMFGVRMPSVSGWRTEGIPKARMMYIQVAHPAAVDGVDTDIATAKPRSCGRPLIDVTARVNEAA